MNLNNLTADKWWSKYKSMSRQEGYEFFKRTLSLGLPADFTEKIDLIGMVFSSYKGLAADRNYDEVIELQELLHKQDPKAFGEERYYVDSFPMEVNLFRKDHIRVKKSMESFISDPVQSIDSATPIVYKLKYYGYDEFIKDLSKEVYFVVRESDELIPGADDMYSDIILAMEFQDLYKNKLDGSPIGRQEFVDELKKYHFNDESELSLSYDTILGDNGLENLCYADCNKDSWTFFQRLFVGFGKYVFDNKNINFATAYDIFGAAWVSFYRDTSTDTTNDTFHDFFKLNKEALYEHISRRLDFLSNRKPYAVAVLWGMHYIYDFLKLNGLVSDENYSDALKFIKDTKTEMIAGGSNSIWEYDFVHFWTKPDSLDEDEFNTEAKYFERTFYEKMDVNEYLPKEYRKKRASIYSVRRKNEPVKKKEAEIGRNDPCPCGSGKKYKKCCG